MLIIQEVTLVWHKEERGGKCAEARSRFNFIFPIERKPDKADECLLDVQRYYQKADKFYTLDQYDKLIFPEDLARSRRTPPPPPVKLSELKVKNIEITEIDGKIQVDFSYDPQLNGKPHRHGHNKDYNNEKSRFFCRDILNETAFTLEVDQKGRIAYNARFVDFDDGTWWYEQTVVNIANISFENYKSNIFSSGKFDFVYEKLAELR